MRINDLLPTKFFLGFFCASPNSCCIAQPSGAKFDRDFLHFLNRKAWCEQMNVWRREEDCLEKVLRRKSPCRKPFQRQQPFREQRCPDPSPSYRQHNLLQDKWFKYMNSKQDCYKNQRGTIYDQLQDLPKVWTIYNHLCFLLQRAS